MSDAEPSDSETSRGQGVKAVANDVADLHKVHPDFRVGILWRTLSLPLGIVLFLLAIVSAAVCWPLRQLAGNPTPHGIWWAIHLDTACAAGATAILMGAFLSGVNETIEGSPEAQNDV